MKKILVTILLCNLIFTGLLAQSNRKSRTIVPSVNKKRITTLIGTKTRYYYSLNADKPSTINVQGPGTLRVLTRGLFASKNIKNLSYKIDYLVDGSTRLQTMQFKNVDRAKKASYKNDTSNILGQLKAYEITIGRGYHTLEFYLNDTITPVLARYFFHPTRNKKQEWISYSPLQPSQPVHLISSESTVNYYRFSTDEPLRVKVNGPTVLRVLTRVENHYQMKGRIKYRMQVKENNQVINTYQLNSRRSEITTYENNTELIPGKAREFVINVPSGNHTYEILPLDKDKSTILGRLLLPKNDVKLEK